jgi:hypothetical protein
MTMRAKAYVIVRHTNSEDRPLAVFTKSEVAEEFCRRNDPDQDEPPNFFTVEEVVLDPGLDILSLLPDPPSGVQEGLGRVVPFRASPAETD